MLSTLCFVLAASVRNPSYTRRYRKRRFDAMMSDFEGFAKDLARRNPPKDTQTSQNQKYQPRSGVGLGVGGSGCGESEVGNAWSGCQGGGAEASCRVINCTIVVRLYHRELSELSFDATTQLTASAQLTWCRGVQHWLEDPYGMPSEVEALPFVRLFIVLAGGRGARSEHEDILIILFFSLSQRAASQAMQRRLLQDDKMCLITSLQLYFKLACVRHVARSVVDALWNFVLVGRMSQVRQCNTPPPCL